MAILTAEQIKAALPTVPQWALDARAIRRTYEFTDFLGSIKFVNALAPLAEAANHHPDIEIQWNKVTLILTTHDQRGLTKKDFDLAKKLDALV